MQSAAKFLVAAAALAPFALFAEEVGERWGTAVREREYYRLVDMPIPKNLIIEAGAFCDLPDGRIAVGTRHGDVFFISGTDAANPEPQYHLFATGLDEIFGLDWKDDALFVTQSAELTKITDTNKDGIADRYDVVSDAWGYGTYHEYAFGSKFDPKGNLHVALGLSSSYHSQELFRGWIFKVTPEGKSIPIASGARSPGGIGYNEHGALFYMESQGPWNCACSLKFVKEGGFMGHPISYNWYEYAPNMGKAPVMPVSGSPSSIPTPLFSPISAWAVRSADLSLIRPAGNSVRLKIKSSSGTTRSPSLFEPPPSRSTVSGKGHVTRFVKSFPPACSMCISRRRDV
jgi:glucose/arabinose dehydrogenase